MKTSSKNILSFLAALAILGLFIFVIIWLYPEKENFHLTSIFDFSNIILTGFGLTIIISIISLVLSIGFGFLLYLISVSRFQILRHLASIYSNLIFGSPLLVFLITITYLLTFPMYRMLGFKVNDFSRVLIGISTLSLYMTPYIKNVFEGAMKTIDENQKQAMTVFGFTPKQKYQYIIIPQILRVILPPLAANLTVIVKSSSLLSFITIPELYNSITNVAARNYLQLEGYLVLFVLYLCITIPLIALTSYLEKRFASWT